jgi:hypothetical protein
MLPAFFWCVIKQCISKRRFVKDADSCNGKIAVAKAEVDKAKKVLTEYQ